MAIIVKALAAGTVPSGTTDIYTVQASRSAVINNVRLVNGNASVTPAMNLYVKPSGSGTTPRRIYNKDFTIGANGSLVLEDGLNLGQGDVIQLALASAQTIAYMLNGVERE